MNWFRAMVVELFAIPAIILLQILGFFWKPKFHQARIGTPILLIHGYINTSAVWLYLKWKIKRFGPVYAINLRGPFSSIITLSKQVEKMAACIEKETGKKELILVGYSMGGLISSYYATHFAPKGKVKKIITISTPFAGTHVAKIAIGKNAKEMNRESSFLKKLKVDVPIVTIASKTDEIVVPYSSALLDGAKQILFDNLGHGGLIFSPRVANVLIHEISEKN